MLQSKRLIVVQCRSPTLFFLTVIATLTSCNVSSESAVEILLVDPVTLVSDQSPHVISLPALSVSNRNISLEVGAIRNTNKEAIAIQFEWIVNDAKVKTVQIAPFPSTQPGRFVIATPDDIPAGAKIEMRISLKTLSEYALSENVSVDIVSIRSEKD